MKNRDFRISDNSRQDMTYFKALFETDVRFGQLYRQAQEVALRYNQSHQKTVSSAKLNSAAVLHLVYETIISFYIRNSETDPFSRITVLAEKNDACKEVLEYYSKMFPSALNEEITTEETLREFFVHQVYQENPALLKATLKMLSQEGMSFPQGTKALKTMLGSYLQGTTITKSSEEDLFSFLTYPARLYPDSLTDQINYILKHWSEFLPDELKTMLLRSLDYINEEDKPHFAGSGPVYAPVFNGEEGDAESFSEDRSWMPNVVMIAKSTLVWLDQLSKKYQRDIHTLDQIPNEELDILRDNGFTALWLIGLWQRSPASKKIKQLCGNPDAESSAYSLKGYVISDRIGGWGALDNLRSRCNERGIRLASDMVPNHTGLDSTWLQDHPEYFVQQNYPPFPSYSYNGQDLSDNPDYEIKIEDHYYNRTDAAVTFMKRDKKTGKVSYIFHGNDGTSMPWNDTAQLDFLNPQTREAVIQQILEVARNFHIIRFDAAMTLAKKHIQRLWYPKPGTGGDVAGRISSGLSEEEFNRRIPNEFWREVVDRVQAEVPDTLLLAGAFWMMESYFVRTLGMHREYNSASMHMMKNQDNKKYRDSVKSTLLFDPEILKRYVNFMNNPDEETAIAQFGDSDKYFGVCTVLATMPGLPMFGHGQIEGFHEKYGMEYQRAYWDEKPNQGLIDEHKRRIFPLLRMRNLFSGCQNFQFFDVIKDNQVQESIYAYTNGDDNQKTLVLYNNQFEHAEGRIFDSVSKMVRTETGRENRSVNIAQAMGLSVKPRRFVIYKNFNENLYYLAPSMKLYEEGYWVSLNGYQTVVLTEIHEIEDIDGIYNSLYEKLQGRGVADIAFEIKLMYLQPFFEAAKVMKGQKMLKDLRTLLCSKTTDNAKKEIMQTLGTYYTYLEELGNLFAKLDMQVRKMKPVVILDYLSRIENACKADIFSKGNMIMDDSLPSVLSAAFLLMPFVEDSSDLSQAYGIAQKLMLSNFYGIDNDIISRSILLITKLDDDTKKLLEDSTFLKLIGHNEYQGVKWYRGEYFQECIYIAILSNAIRNSLNGEVSKSEIESQIKYWLRRDEFALYKIDNLKE